MSFSSSHGNVKNKSGEVECYCRVKAPGKFNFFEWIDPSEFSEIQSENGNEEMEEEKQNLLSEIKRIRNEIACLKENG
ncbi:hypothetical protein V6N13_064478 [Hibiscus sabdariffa]